MEKAIGGILVTLAITALIAPLIWIGYLEYKIANELDNKSSYLEAVLDKERIETLEKYKITALGLWPNESEAKVKTDLKGLGESKSFVTRMISSNSTIYLPVEQSSIGFIVRKKDAYEESKEGKYFLYIEEGLKSYKAEEIAQNIQKTFDMAIDALQAKLNHSDDPLNQLVVSK